MQRRRLVSHSGRLTAEKKRLEQQAEKLSSGPAKDQLASEDRSNETVSRMDKWLSSRLAVVKVTSEAQERFRRHGFSGLGYSIVFPEIGSRPRARRRLRWPPREEPH
jgi:hypothetical protein